MIQREFTFPAADGHLHAHLSLPLPARGLVLLTQACPLPLEIASDANPGSHHWAVLRLDLLTPQEASYSDTRHNVPLLTGRLLEVLDTLRQDADTEGLPIGIFARALVAPAAIRAAAQRDLQVRALVCHGGKIDLAGLQYLGLLAAPLLMLIDADDDTTERSFQRAAAHLKALHISHRLAPDDNLAGQVTDWFGTYLQAV